LASLQETCSLVCSATLESKESKHTGRHAQKPHLAWQTKPPMAPPMAKLITALFGSWVTGFLLAM